MRWRKQQALHPRFYIMIVKTNNNYIEYKFKNKKLNQ